MWRFFSKSLLRFLLMLILPVSFPLIAFAEPIPKTFKPDISQTGVLRAAENETGTTIKWEIILSNPTQETGINVRVTNSLIPALQIKEVFASKGAYQINGQNVQIMIPFLQPDETVLLNIITTVLEKDKRIDNSSCVTAANMEGTNCAGTNVNLQLPSDTLLLRNSIARSQMPLLGILAIGAFLAFIGTGTALSRHLSEL